MHELSVCQGLVAEVERVARAHGAIGVERVDVRIGALCGVEPGLLAAAFSIARAGTIAAHAELRIDTVGARIECSACGTRAEVPSNRLLCPVCGEWRVRLLSGEEMLLERVVLVSDAQPAPSPNDVGPALARPA